MKKLREASRPNLAFMILVFFVLSFISARVFTTFFPSTILIVGGYHIHHFFYGIVLLVIGGWLGINYHQDQIDRIAAVIFGVGGGLVGDEIGFIVTFNYYSEITYTFVVSLLAFAFMATIVKRHGKAILTELGGFFRINLDLYVGLFLASVSSAFLIQSDNKLAVVLSGITLIVGLALVLRRIIRHVKHR